MTAIYLPSADGLSDKPHRNGPGRYFPCLPLAVDKVKKRANKNKLRNQMAFCSLTYQPHQVVQACKCSLDYLH